MLALNDGRRSCESSVMRTAVRPRPDDGVRSVTARRAEVAWGHAGVDADVESWQWRDTAMGPHAKAGDWIAVHF